MQKKPISKVTGSSVPTAHETKGHILTFVKSQLSRNADDAQLPSGNPRILAEEAKLVAHFHDK
jgi:hypothetical protein